MENNEPPLPGLLNLDDDPALSTILNYYKKFGRKRNLEQYFSLSTAQSELRDTTSTFWRGIKMQEDSSDSGDKQTESPTEVCRISIKCSMPDPSSSQDEDSKKSKMESESPPIINEDVPGDPGVSPRSDRESLKSPYHQSPKSPDAAFDTSMNKPPSPTSSVTSQRKLEWDSLADVGYANESDKKVSSSLSTLERLVLNPHYSNNEDDNEIGPPTAHSTLAEVHEPRKKGKRRGFLKKITEVHNKDVDTVEVNMPSTSIAQPQSFCVNLTKHISFNVEKEGQITVEKEVKDISVSPTKNPVETEVTPPVHADKEIQTSMLNSAGSATEHKHRKPHASKSRSHSAPVYISLNTLRRRIRRRRAKVTKGKKKQEAKHNRSVHEKSGEQVSEAESFEYMPGHIYHQNQLQQGQKARNSAGNKSSLESSGALTTESSKYSSNSLRKDLDKSIAMIQEILKRNMEDSNLKKQLVKDVVKKLLTSKYRDDGSTSDFLSGLSLSSKRLKDYTKYSTTTSTSDLNVSERKVSRPKKSILRMDKFNANAIASTSQSAPNLASVSKNENPELGEPPVPKISISSHTETDMSSKDKDFSDDTFAPPKTSSEVLYKQYLEATKMEEKYKRHLLDKRKLLRQKLVCSDSALRPAIPEMSAESKNRLQELLKDLTRNNYDDGSGDASKLEGNNNAHVQNVNNSGDYRRQRSHSVFTLSSGVSECKCADERESRKAKLRSRLQEEIQKGESPRAGTSKGSHCDCNNRAKKPTVADSSVQVNVHSLNRECFQIKIPKSPRKLAQDFSEVKVCPHKIVDDTSGDLKYVCICTSAKDAPENVLIYKCSKPCNVVDKNDIDEHICNRKETKSEQSTSSKISLRSPRQKSSHASPRDLKLDLNTRSSQTNIPLNLFPSQKSSQKSCAVSSRSRSPSMSPRDKISSKSNIVKVHSGKNTVAETTRWTQTEISINPQISDPSLSDINIMNDGQTSSIVSQTVRDTKRKPSEKQHAQYIMHSKDTNSARSAKSDDSTKSASKNRKNDYEYDDKDVVGSGKIELYTKHDNNGENFTIPVRGTNMTLVLSIGSKQQVESAKENFNAKETARNERVEYADTATSIQEECTKAAQASQTEAIMEDKRVICGEESYGDVNPSTSQSYKNDFVKSCCGDNVEYNTYPKKVTKPLLRSNTDTAMLDAAHSTNESDFKSNADFKRSLLKTTYNQRNEGLKNTPRSLKSNSAASPTRSEKKESTIQKPNKLIPEDKSKPCKVASPGRKETKTTIEEVYNKLADYDESTTAKEKRYVASRTELKDNNLEKFYKIASEDNSKAENAMDVLDSNRDRSDGESKKSVASDHRKQSTDSHDTAVEIIKDITKRYSKKDLDKNKRKKCFKEIMQVLNYLLDTEDSTDGNTPAEESGHSESDSRSDRQISGKNAKGTSVSKVAVSTLTSPRCMVDKGVQQTQPKTKSTSKSNRFTESSEMPVSSDILASSSDSATCKVLNKIKKECEKYHQRRCKSTHIGTNKCECSSSTSVTCEDCRKVHYCHCRVAHKCRGHKTEKVKKGCVAYNLIIQTSDSVMSDDNAACERVNTRKLSSIVLKVPSRKHLAENIPVKHMVTKSTYCNRKISPVPSPSRKTTRSRSLPSKNYAFDAEDLKSKTVKEYLECNRPNFIRNATSRQTCLKEISETRASERAAKRQLLSMQLERGEAVSVDLDRLARDLGFEMRQRKPSAKFISEKEMKKHSEKIYKSLPEVQRKKDDLKKESIKKTNLLMASIFKKNLQKKTLRGTVNLSNYSPVIKI